MRVACAPRPLKVLVGVDAVEEEPDLVQRAAPADIVSVPTVEPLHRRQWAGRRRRRLIWSRLARRRP